MRLDGLLAKLRSLSRAQAKQAIKAGRVLVNGRPPRPEQDISAGDEVLLDGAPLSLSLERHYLMNKPAGVLTAARDPKQKTVLDLLPADCRALACMPVGRLDKDTEGLLLFTTDGELCHRLLSPKRRVDKCYLALVLGQVRAETAHRFEQGGRFGDLEAESARLDLLSPQEAAALLLPAPDANQSAVRVTVHEGQYHQVKRMLAACGHEVLYLRRVSFGPLRLDGQLAPGAFRALTPDEVNDLRKAAAL